MKNTHVPILIVGAGPVGLATAAMLHRYGLRVRIIDKAVGPTPYSKAVGMHARTLEAMHALGLTEQLISDGHPLTSFRLVDGDQSIMSAGFDGMGSAYEFVLGLPQRCTERRLLARLQAHGGDVEWQTSLVNVGSVGNPNAEDELAQVLIEQADGMRELVSCRWLIGADGGRSMVREQASIAFNGGDYGNAFILGDARIEWDGPKNDLQFFLSPSGYLLLVPMPNGLHRIIAQTDHTYDEFQGKDRPGATLDQLQAIVDRNGPGNLRVHSPEWLTCAPFYHRLAETSVKGRVALVGDAFHLFSPLGAQGLNTGFQDCFNLAWKLAFIERGWSPVGLLDTYRQEREPMAKLIGNITARTTRYITATHPLQRWARRHATRLLNPTAKVQERLPRLLAGLMQSYGANAALSGPCAPGLPAAGGRIPHAWVAEGQSYRPLASLIHGSVYTVLLVGPRIEPAALERLKLFWTEAMRAHLPFVQVQLVTREIGEIESLPKSLPAGVRLIHDLLGEVGAVLGQGAPCTVLVRPDGYCALSALGWELDSVGAYFAQRSLGLMSMPGLQGTTAKASLEASHAQ